ncbi:MAG: hypothetical protein IT372_07530 [Polyangiaceae bacterium]|nr:hypothetical protein [Polyangiaceae bacterium]
MNAYVTDTHALIWHLTADAQLSPTCREVFEAADRGEAKIWIPGIVLVETIYLAEKARFPNALVVQMLDLVDPPTVGYAVASAGCTCRQEPREHRPVGRSRHARPRHRRDRIDARSAVAHAR